MGTLRNKDKKYNFELLLGEAITDLPKKFQKALQNLAIVIEDEPNSKLLKDLDHDSEEPLLGLYIGVPLPERTFGEAPELPDQIFIFRGPLERMCRSSTQLRDQIRVTLIHELAHYFGFDEDYLEEIGLD